MSLTAIRSLAKCETLYCQQDPILLELAFDLILLFAMPYKMAANIFT